MILASDIVNTLKSHLDAEDSDRWTFDRDFQYAINRAIDYMVQVFTAALAQRKFSEENLSELLRVEVHKASGRSSLTFSESQRDAIWSITSVYPLPITDPINPTLPPDNATESQVLDCILVDTVYDAGRLTQEQWSKSKDNYFARGNTMLEGDLASYAFLNFVRTGADTDRVIYIRPSVANRVVGVGVLSYPDHITAEDSQILFPKSLTNFLVDKSLFYLAYKQGDNITAAGITDKEIKELISLL